MMKLFGWLLSGIAKAFVGLWRTVVQVFHSVGLATCLALFAASIALASTNGWFDWAAQLVPVFGPAVLAVFKGGLTCLMAFAAGFGFCYCNTELIKERADKQAEEMAKTIVEKEKLENENNGLRNACVAKEKELQELKEQNNALRSARIDIKSLMPILKISLAEVEMQVKEAYLQWVNKSLCKTLTHRPTAKRFVGICQKDFKTRLEVDLQKASIRVDETNKIIYVSNLNPDPFPGESQTKWLVEEVLEYKMRAAKSSEGSDVFDKDGSGYVPDESALPEGVKTYFGGDEMRQTEREFESRLSDRIKSTTFEGYDLAIRFAKEAAKQFVRMILAPCEKNGYRLNFTKEEPEMESWPYRRQNLLDYIAEYNARQLPASANPSLAHMG